jgi:Na+-driven multidrug efflux pump
MSTEAPSLHVADAGSVSRFVVVGRIVSQAVPLAVAACILSALNLGMLAVLSRHGDLDAIYLMSLMQPAFFFVIAVMEGLAVTNQVFSARSKHAWSKRNILISSRSLSVLGIVAIVAVSGLSWGLSKGVATESRSYALIASYLPLALLSMTAFLVFEIYHGALRGRGRALLGLVPFAFAAGLSILCTWVLLREYELGFEAVLIGNFVGPFLMLPLVILLLHREAGTGESMAPADFRSKIHKLIKTVGLPVFSSVIVASIGAAVLFPVLDRFGEDDTSAFLVIVRLRVAFMFPAIAAGSAIAILINQSGRVDDSISGRRYLATGIPLFLCVYALATATLYFNQSIVIGAIVPEQAAPLNIASQEMLYLLLPTFFLIPCSVLVQIILEQVGDGIKVFLLSAAIELLTVFAVIFAVAQDMPLVTICLILSASASFGFICFLLRIYFISKTWESPDAV